MFLGKIRQSLSTKAKHLAKQMPTLVLVFWAAACVHVLAADVVYIDQPGGQSSTRQQVDTVAKLYGLEENVILLDGKADRAPILKAIRSPQTVAVIINADALPTLDQKQVLAAMQRAPRRSLPLLIAGITEKSDQHLLSRWSEGAIQGCKELANEQGAGSYAVARSKDLTRQLGGSKLPMNAGPTSYLILDSHRTEWLIDAQVGGLNLPVFAVSVIGSRQLFFATAVHSPDFTATSDPYHEPAVFATLAPQLMFLRFAAGDRAWHGTGHYANLTIDDPWLREPYGHVNYEGLLREMEQHNFHTTLAFIPWNFDRSQPAMVSLFRAHGDRYSICIHGNNHDHQEFGPYDRKPLDGQTKDIKQALARMARFSELTRLPFDPVMVFPHSIAPEPTLAVLKRYNFLATTNSLNVPLGANPPADAEFALRPVAMNYGNFPSIRRYSVEAPIPESQLAIDAFLDSPMLFYAHQDFFAPGIGAFNKTADAVNQLQPDTQWRGLGYIAQHLYLEKLRDDGDYDVRAYAGTIHLENGRHRDATFFVEKEEDFALPLTVLVDGRPYPYQRSDTGLRLQLRVGAGQGREVAIKYANDLNLAMDISKSSPRIYAIRLLSDFRDNVVSTTSLGRWFSRSYSDHGNAWNRAMGVLLAGMALTAIALCYVRREKKR